MYLKTIFFILFSYLVNMNAQESVKGGLVDTFNELLKIRSENYLKKKSELDPSLEITKEGELSIENNQTALSESFLTSILFESQAISLALGIKDECSFYDLILSKLLTIDENQEDPLFIIKSKGQIRTIKQSLFFAEYVSKKCPSVKNLSQFFALNNLKSTLSQYTIQPVKTRSQCKVEFQKFINDVKAPYLCYLTDVINNKSELEDKILLTPPADYKKLIKLKNRLKKVEGFESVINPYALQYLTRLCQHAESEKHYCDEVFHQTYWKRITQKEIEPKRVMHLCEALYQKPLNSKELEDITPCLKSLDKKPLVCQELNYDAGGAYPKQTCPTLAKALSLTKMKDDLHDCPKREDLHSITLLSRIVSHFFPNKFGNLNCQNFTGSYFVHYLHRSTGTQVRKNALCYNDPLKDYKKCMPIVYSDIEEKEYAITRTMESILYKLMSFGKTEKCTFTESSKFNNALLKYKSGCHILYDDENCTEYECPITVLYNEKKIENKFEHKMGAHVSLFPLAYDDKGYNIFNIIKSTLKLEQKKMNTVFQLKNILSSKKNALIYGSGCLEDIYPHIKKREYINVCTPMPFLISNIIQDDGFSSVVINTGLDPLQEPRIVDWQNLLIAMKNFQIKHPQKEWPLYAVYKD